MAYTYALQIKESDLDTFGHVNNAKYLTFFEEARWEFITQNGYGLQKIRETGIGPTLLEVTLRFMKELRLRDKIIIESKSVSYEKKILRIEQKIIRGEEVCCQGNFVIALFDIKERKIIMPTPDWLKAVGM
jgi:acyl-CoA thioester hydrolase